MSGGVWIASYVLLWIAVLVLGLAVVALLRQIGVLHARIRPSGVHHGGEGLPTGSDAPYRVQFDYAGAPLTVLVFTSPDCTLCAALMPSLHSLARAYPEIRLSTVEHAEDTAEIFEAFRVRSTPYLVAVGSDGTIQGGGIVNTMEQAEVLLEGLGAPAEPARREPYGR